MYGHPRIGNPFGRFSRRLVKQGALPIGICWKAQEEVRSALCITNAETPDVYDTKQEAAGYSPRRSIRASGRKVAK